MLIGVGAQTCRPPSISALGHRQVGYLAFGSRPVGSPENCRWGADRSAVWRSGADLSALQHIGVGEPTGRFPRKLPLGARHVGSLEARHCQYIIENYVCIVIVIFGDGEGEGEI